MSRVTGDRRPMAFDLPLPEHLSVQGWRAKVRDREGPEDPHITVLFKTEAWRFKLRDMTFMDREPPPRRVPKEIVDTIKGASAQVCAAWNALYPNNPV